jgi:hypothetical protein
MNGCFQQRAKTVNNCLGFERVFWSRKLSWFAHVPETRVCGTVLDGCYAGLSARTLFLMATAWALPKTVSETHRAKLGTTAPLATNRRGFLLY